MNIKKISVLLIFIVLFSFVGIQSLNAMSNTDIAGWDIIHTYWNVLDLNYKITELKDPTELTVVNYKKEYEKLEKLSLTLSDSIISNLRNGNDSSLLELSNFYKKLEEYQKPAFEVVVSRIVEFINSNNIQNNKKWGSTPDLFPGYGYADPKYKYKKGLELSREVISSYWQDEEHTTESEKSFEGTIDIEVAAELKNNPNVKDYKEIGEPFKLNVGGHVKFYVKASFTAKDKLVTNAKKQYVVNRVWYELYRAKKSAWSSSEWELCGKTYENQVEPGIVVTVGAQFK